MATAKQNDLEMVWMDRAKLSPYPSNPVDHPDNQVAVLCHRFGSRLYGVLLQAGFVDVATAGSYDDASRNPVYFVSPFVDLEQSATIVRLGWADAASLAEFTAAWKSSSATSARREMYST